MITTPNILFFVFSQLGHRSTEGLDPAAGQEVREDLEADLGHLEVEGHVVGHEIDPPGQRRQTVISMCMYSYVCVVVVVERFLSSRAIATCLNFFLHSKKTVK